MENKKLAIISDCVHFRMPNGSIATENHIFLKQMEALAAQFSGTIICCPFANFSGTQICTEYVRDIEFYPSPNVGGDSVSDKIAIAKATPVWWKIFKKLYSRADYFYLRFPNNLNIPGFFYFNLKNKPLFATYTGTWENYAGEPATYRLQKWLLQKYFKGPVWIYAEVEEKQKNFFEGFSPSYDLKIWEDESENVHQKISKLKSGKQESPVFISVGALVAYKNQQFILDACLLLKKANLKFTLFIIGDGPLKNVYENFIQENQLSDCIFLTGKKNYEEMRMYYRKADFLLQAPLAEGFGKTPIEGFFHGVIPFLSNTFYGKKMTGIEKRGFVFSTETPAKLSDLIKEKLEDNQLLANIIEAGRSYSKDFTLENWVNDFMKTLQHFYENQALRK